MQNGPYGSIEEMKKKNSDKFTPEMKAILAKYEKNLVALKPAPEVRCVYVHTQTKVNVCMFVCMYTYVSSLL